MSILWMLSELRTPLGEHVFQVITFLGQKPIVIGVICFLYWCYNKRLAYEIGFSFFTAGLFVQTLKIFFRIPRPWVLDPDFKAVSSAVPGATGYSFPSGHTQSATSLYSSLALQTHKNGYRFLFVCCFLLVGFSRLYLGVHTPKDVLCSMGISLLCCLGIHYLFQTIWEQSKYTGRISLILAVLSFIAVACALFLLYTGAISEEYAADSLTAAGSGLGFAAGFYVERTYLNFHITPTISGKILRLAIGLISLLLLQTFLSMLPLPNLPGTIIEYFILVFWILVVYPYLFSIFPLRRNQ